jgi:hypothetical protein
MAERQEHLRELAVAIIEDIGEDAYRWTMVRAAHSQNEGDRARAAFWEDVAALVLKIQSGGGSNSPLGALPP